MGARKKPYLSSSDSCPGRMSGSHPTYRPRIAAPDESRPRYELALVEETMGIVRKLVVLLAGRAAWYPVSHFEERLRLALAPLHHIVQRDLGGLVEVWATGG